MATKPKLEVRLNWTTPLKLPTGVTTIVEVVLEPLGNMTWFGLAAITKSGSGEIMNWTTDECDRLPLVPVTVMFPDPPIVEARTVNVVVADALLLSVTVGGLNDQVVQRGEQPDGGNDG